MSNNFFSNRRNFLKWLGFGGVGAVFVLALKQLRNNSYNSSSPTERTSTSTPTATSLFVETAKPPKLSPIQFASVKLDNNGKEISKPAGKAKIFTESIGNGINLTMVKIPAGKFLMGSPKLEEDRQNNESSQHEVKVPEFYMAQTLVKQSQWQAMMGNNPSHASEYSELPVERVSWLNAMEFCQKLSEKTGRRYTLPSEAQWEYACRAGTTTPFTFGETITPSVACYNGYHPYGNVPKGEPRDKTTPVGSFPPNLFGLYDMHGNLWEWCLDEYEGYYDSAPTDGSARGDINSRSEEKIRLLRGGSWRYGARACRSASRYFQAASFSFDIIGFRVAWVPPKNS
jgi:formylglycine-generating enzyme required for sulfatase activity